MGVNTTFSLSKGEIASCAGPQLYLWTMKGQLLTCTDTSCGPRADILCVSFTQRQEWDNRNVVVTGCADGIIQVIVMLFVARVRENVCIWSHSLAAVCWNNRSAGEVVLSHTVSNCGSDYFGISLTVHQGINNSIWAVCESVCFCLGLK